MKVTIKIEFAGKEIELSEEEANELFQKLESIMRRSAPVFIPCPNPSVPPYHWDHTAIPLKTTPETRLSFPQVWC